MLYECNKKEVPLNNEIAVLKKYVELEKLRYGSRLDVSFSCSGQTARPDDSAFIAVALY
jgi:two-component system LytT family sensor kinase